MVIAVFLQRNSVLFIIFLYFQSHRIFLIWIPASGILVIWQQWTNSQESCRKNGMAWPLSQGESTLTLAWIGFYCFSGQLTWRRVPLSSTEPLPQKFTPQRWPAAEHPEMKKQKESLKMGRQRKNSHLKEMEESPVNELNEIEVSKLSDIEFKRMLIRMLNEHCEN